MTPQSIPDLTSIHYVVYTLTVDVLVQDYVTLAQQ